MTECFGRFPFHDFDLRPDPVDPEIVGESDAKSDKGKLDVRLIVKKERKYIMNQSLLLFLVIENNHKTHSSL